MTFVYLHKRGHAGYRVTLVKIYRYIYACTYDSAAVLLINIKTARGENVGVINFEFGV